MLEALPGLYGPQAFLRELADAERLFKSVAGTKAQERTNLLGVHYQESYYQLSVAWFNDTTKIGGKAPEGFVFGRNPKGQITAVMAAQLAATKAITEFPLLGAMRATSAKFEKITDEDAWRKIAQLHASDAVLDSRSIALIKRQNPALSDADVARMVHGFQELIALDTVRNEYLMRMKLYPWLLRDPSRGDLAKFNEKVYAELFLTPSSDAWLGLLEKDVYLGIDNAGVR